MLDVGRHIADELLQITGALNDILSRATRLVTLSNALMMERLMLKCQLDGEKMPVAEDISPQLTRFEVENVHPRLWVHQIEDGCVVAGDKMQVSWETIGSVPLVNVRIKNCMGVETMRGKTVQRLTKEEGEPNRSPVETTIPLDFVPGKYTVAVSEPANNIRGMTFVSILRPISVADITEPPTGLGRSLTSWRAPTWSRGKTHRICWKMHRGKSQVIMVSIAIGTSSEGPWRTLRGASELKFRAPDFKPPPGSTPTPEKLIPPLEPFPGVAPPPGTADAAWEPQDGPLTPSWCERSPGGSPSSQPRDAGAEAGAEGAGGAWGGGGAPEWAQPTEGAAAAASGGGEEGGGASDEWFGGSGGGGGEMGAVDGAAARAGAPGGSAWDGEGGAASALSSAGAAISGLMWS